MRERTLAKEKGAGIQGLGLSCLLTAIVVAYSLLYFDNTYPISDGWGINFVELMFHGKVPYRDFYYYLPPLNLWIDALFWKLSFGSLLAFRGWYLAQRVVIYLLIFRLLRRYFNQYYAFLACVFTAILATSDVYDLIGDYNQTMVLVEVLLIYCAVSFARAGTTGKKLLSMGLAGIMLGLAFLNKQPIFVASVIVFFLALTALCILKKDKRYWAYCLSTAGGMILPIAAAFIYLAVNGALTPFIEQVFLNVDGKGSLYDILVRSLTFRMKEPGMWAIIFLVAGLLLLEDPKSENGGKRNAAAVGALLLGLILCVYGIYKSDIAAFSQIIPRHRSAMASVLLCFFLFAASLYSARRDRGSLSPEAIVRLKTLAVLAGTLAMVGINLYTSVFAEQLYTETPTFYLVEGVMMPFLIICSVILFVWLLYMSQKAEDGAERGRNEELLFICCGGFSLIYAAAMGCGTSNISSHGLRLILPLAISMFLSQRMKHPIVSRVLKGGVIAVCIVLATACVSQKIICSYSWWGTSMAPRDDKIYTVDIPAMKGIKVSADQKELYETVTKVIEENTDEDAVIFGYPHIKVFNILTERYNMNTFVPVLFYDVVADVYVEKEAELLKENLPDVVIWEQIDWILETHESVFRNGEPLKQREIEAYFAQILPEKYDLKAQVGSVSVYILKQDRPAESGA